MNRIHNAMIDLSYRHWYALPENPSVVMVMCHADLKNKYEQAGFVACQ
jgi:hypothetical protein